RRRRLVSWSIVWAGLSRSSYYFAPWHDRSLDRRAAEFLQALAPLLPGGGVEDADGRQFIDFEAGNHLGPELDPFRIAAKGLRDRPQARRLVVTPRQSCL